MSNNQRGLSIQEVSLRLKLPKHTLRFWEKEFAEFLKPVRTNGGQRRYGLGDLEVIEKIQKLVHRTGMSLAAAKEVLITERQLDERKRRISDGLRRGEEFVLVMEEVAEMIKERVVDLYLKERMEEK